MQPPCNLCALLYDETPHQDAQSIAVGAYVPWCYAANIYTSPEYSVI